MPKHSISAERSTAPLVKLSLNLIDTYRNINKVYYEQKSAQKKQKKNQGFDNENCDYILKMGEVWLDRYTIAGLLGKGSFGQVTQAYDSDLGKDVAIKIIKNKSAFRRQAQIEIGLLEKIREADPDDHHHLVRMLTTFEHRNHLCIAFELLSFNLYDLIRNTNFRGVSLNLIRKFSRQIVDALDFLASSRLSIIHCDLKPENILLRSPKRTAIKVVDFGSSCHIGQTMYPYIQSRFYRSPEVLLGLPYTEAIDVWSLGCIMFELHTGDPIFNGSSQRDQVYKIAEVLGIPPLNMLERGRNVGNYFNKVSPSHYNMIRSTKHTYVPPGKRDISISLGSKTGGPKGRRLGEMGHTHADYSCFEDLLLKCLCYDPEQRIKPHEAMQHPFLASVSSNALSSSSSSTRVHHRSHQFQTDSSTSQNQHQSTKHQNNSSSTHSFTQPPGDSQSSQQHGNVRQKVLHSQFSQVVDGNIEVGAHNHQSKQSHFSSHHDCSEKKIMLNQCNGRKIAQTGFGNPLLLGESIAGGLPASMATTFRRKKIYSTKTYAGRASV